MKRTERHHLKQDELTAQLLHAREVVEARRREVTAAVIAIVVVAVAALGYFGWREHVQSKSHELLADAMAVQDARIQPPGGTMNAPAVPGVTTFPTEQARAEAALGKFKTAADAYPSTDSGLFARYQQAALLNTLNRPGEAMVAYQELSRRGGDGVYGQMGRLGLAESQVRAGQYDAAINALKELAQRKDGPLPIDAVLVQLGRAQVDAGRPADAQQTFNRIVQEFPDSQYTAEARRQLETLKKT